MNDESEFFDKGIEKYYDFMEGVGKSCIYDYPVLLDVNDAITFYDPLSNYVIKKRNFVISDKVDEHLARYFTSLCKTKKSLRIVPSSGYLISLSLKDSIYNYLPQENLENEAEIIFLSPVEKSFEKDILLKYLLLENIKAIRQNFMFLC